MKEVRKFLRKNKPLEVEITGARGERSRGYLLPNRLAVLGPKKDILYPLSYVTDHNASRYIPDKHVAILDELFKIDDVIEYILEPDRFMDELTYSHDVDDDKFTIEIDGQWIYISTSSMRCDKARNSYLRERKLGNIKFDHMKIMSPMGYRTDFIFPGRTDTQRMISMLKRDMG